MRFGYLIAPVLLLTACSEAELEDQTDEEIAEVEKQVEEDAKSLEEAASEAVKVLEEEIEADLAEEGIGQPTEVPSTDTADE